MINNNYIEIVIGIALLIESSFLGCLVYKFFTKVYNRDGNYRDGAAGAATFAISVVAVAGLAALIGGLATILHALGLIHFA